VAILRDLRGLLAAVSGDDDKRYRLAERVAHGIHPQAILSGRDRSWLRDGEFREVFRSFRGDGPNRMMDRAYFIGQLARYVAAGVPGDTVECGCYTGLTSHEICRYSQPGKRHHVFDSFEGVSDPGSIDGKYWNSGDLAASEETLLRNLSQFDVTTHPGWIPDRFDEVAGTQFSLVHIDVDLYQPTFDSISFFYERVPPFGMIVCDDYGFSTCPGATQAIDEFMSDKPEIVLNVPTGQGVIVKS